MYYGSVSPWESTQLSTNKEYNETLKRAFALQEQLDAMLGVEGKKGLDDFLKANAKVGNFFEKEKFTDGFILGARLMIEVLTDTRFFK